MSTLPFAYPIPPHTAHCERWCTKMGELPWRKLRHFVLHAKNLQITLYWPNTRQAVLLSTMNPSGGGRPIRSSSVWVVMTSHSAKFPLAPKISIRVQVSPKKRRIFTLKGQADENPCPDMRRFRSRRRGFTLRHSKR